MPLNLKEIVSSVKGLIFFGWIVAAIRLALDITATDAAMYFGVYYAMPLAYLYMGVKAKLDHLSWTRLALSMVVVAFFVWLIPNVITYTTAQFMEWDFGRFAPGGAGTIAASSFDKLITGVTLGFGTMLPGTGWSIVFATLFIYVPKRIRARAVKAE
jgi:hypothetical protein